MGQFYYLTLSDIGLVLQAVSYFSFETQKSVSTRKEQAAKRRGTRAEVRAKKN